MKKITNKEDFLLIIPMLRDINFTDMTYLDCLAKCLSGQYQGVIGSIDNKPVGVMIYYFYANNTKAFIVGVWCRMNLKHFIDSGFKFFKDAGIKTVRCSASMQDYEKKAGMKKLWTVYERQL